MQKIITASASVVIDFADGFSEYIVKRNSAVNTATVFSFINISEGAGKRIVLAKSGIGNWAVSFAAGVKNDYIGTNSQPTNTRLSVIDAVALGATSADVFARCSY